MTERLRDDAYFTPQAAAIAIVKHVAAELYPTESPKTIIEPSCGTGVFIGACSSIWPTAKIIGIEPNDHAIKWNNAQIHRMTLEYALANGFDEGGVFSDLARPLLVIGNPPFSLAESHILGISSRLLRGDDDHLVFLLRLGFLCSQLRAREFWPLVNLKSVLPLARRPSFAFGCTDSQEYAAFQFNSPNAHNELSYPAKLYPARLW